jgi:HSP20 family protein
VRFFDLGDEFLILVELPGATEAELSVQANRELVRIRAHHTDVLPRNMRSVIDERTPLRFNQSIKLYCPIDPDAVRAQYAQGVLELRLPKMAHAPSDITIREL